MKINFLVSRVNFMRLRCSVSRCTYMWMCHAKEVCICWLYDTASWIGLLSGGSFVCVRGLLGVMVQPVELGEKIDCQPDVTPVVISAVTRVSRRSQYRPVIIFAVTPVTISACHHIGRYTSHNIRRHVGHHIGRHIDCHNNYPPNRGYCFRFVCLSARLSVRPRSFLCGILCG